MKHLVGGLRWFVRCEPLWAVAELAVTGFYGWLLVWAAWSYWLPGIRYWFYLLWTGRPF